LTFILTHYNEGFKFVKVLPASKEIILLFFGSVLIGLFIDLTPFCSTGGIGSKRAAGRMKPVVKS